MGNKKNNQKKKEARERAAELADAKAAKFVTTTPNSTPKALLKRVCKPKEDSPDYEPAPHEHEEEEFDVTATAFEARSMMEALESIMLAAWTHGTRLSQYESQNAARALLAREDTPPMMQARALLLFAKSYTYDDHCTSWYAQAAYTTASDAWLVAVLEGEAYGWDQERIKDAKRLLKERMEIQDAAGDILDDYFDRKLGVVSEDGSSEGLSTVGSDGSSYGSGVSPVTAADTDPSSVEQEDSIGSPGSLRSF